MANHEDYLDALTAFARDGSKEIPQILEQYLNGVAKNGETLFQWPLLKPLIVGKMEQVIEELQHGLSSENITSRPNVENVRFDVMRTRIMDAVHKFTGAPFTIQRLCELLIDPRRHYKRSDKFMRGLEKNVLVVSTVDPFGRKVVSEVGNKHLVNGMDNGIPIFSRESGISSNLPPVPGWVTTSATTISRSQDSPEKVESSGSNHATNGEASSLVNPVFGDQGDQPPAVHAEEVVETAVTLEMSESGPEATGAGEAMADEEDEEIETEDTNASTSSSSSSSSEDLSNPDANENPSAGSTTLTAISSSSSEPSHARPWASIAEEREKHEEHSLDAETNEMMPEMSKGSDSEYQDDNLTFKSQPSTVISPSTNGVDCPTPMDTTASTSSHTGPPQEDTSNQPNQPIGIASESAPLSQNHDRPDLVSTMAVQSEVEGKGSKEAGQAISTSSSSSSPSSFTPSASYSEAEASHPYPDDSSEQKMFSVGGEIPPGNEEEKGVSDLEPSQASATVTSSEANSFQLTESLNSKDVSSSNYQSLFEGSEEEPQAKHRRLSDDFESPFSSLKSNAQDLEPSSSSGACPNIASSTEDPSSAMTVTTTSSLISSTADTVAIVNTCHSPTVTKSTLDSTTDGAPLGSSLESSAPSEQTNATDVGGADGDMPQSSVKWSQNDLSVGVTDSHQHKPCSNSPDKGSEIKDQSWPADNRDSVTSLADSSKNDLREEPMDQD
ncbi:cysteine-rich with egf-like domain protein 2 [Plakobranchus ocellatus]|uniref:Cysteine-rich with egf-like domain protein 2 n=1 Tax=Plakobranchus ocellatus TaxID=259542 RepID=A0AAV4DJN3_9GAST|nr:cysteine-rich with egf-like domain protein 2 [Plakobranchus ocellatus]